VLPSAKAPMDLFVKIRFLLTKKFIYQKYDWLSRFPGMSGQVFLQPALEIYAGNPFCIQGFRQGPGGRGLLSVKYMFAWSFLS
jgi:hypothetical protein